MPAFDDLLPSIHQRFAAHAAERGIPGVAWGAIRDGELVHAAGLGTARDGEERLPDGDTVFRIASMTKSFTAAAVLLLRDEGRLRLDDPVAQHVPELRAWRPTTADSGPVTIRQLLTMSAGLSTDDPWGDRQQGLPLSDFARLLEAGPSVAWPPDTTFDYSNLGYGILGRVVTNIEGVEYREVVRERLLVPLGMTSSAYDEDAVLAARLAHGYVRRGDALVREGRDPYGAFASMGGLYSTVRDLARWVAGLLDAFPARDDPDDTHPVRRASRREMQQLHRAFGAKVEAQAPDQPPSVLAGGYGYGLFVLMHPSIGTVVAHSGGYPGYGSAMTWHPASGTGLIAVGNLRYAGLSWPAGQLLPVLVQDGGVRRRMPRPWPALGRFQALAEDLVATWDDELADAAFAMNMDLDEPRPDRRAAVEKVSADLGPFRTDASRPVVEASPAHRRWWLRGERGWVQLEILLTPEPEPLIQTLKVAPVGDPSAALVSAAERLLVAAGEPAPAWPADLPRAATLDAAAIEQTLRAASARFGRLGLGLPRAGDGVTSTTWDLATERGGRATLKIEVDVTSGSLEVAELRAAAVEPGAEGW